MGTANVGEYSIDEPIRFIDDGPWMPVIERMDCPPGTLREHVGETQWRLRLPNGKTHTMRMGESASGMSECELADLMKTTFTRFIDALDRHFPTNGSANR
jgi:hypothetical protein